MMLSRIYRLKIIIMKSPEISKINLEYDQRHRYRRAEEAARRYK